MLVTCLLLSLAGGGAIVADSRLLSVTADDQRTATLLDYVPAEHEGADSGAVSAIAELMPAETKPADGAGATSPPPPGFVSTNGTGFYVNGSSFTVTGCNQYYLMLTCVRPAHPPARPQPQPHPRLPVRASPPVLTLLAAACTMRAPSAPSSTRRRRWG